MGRGRRPLVFFLGSLVLAVMAAPAPALERADGTDGGYERHAPIRIEGNDGFHASGSGVRGGSGTPADPFLISRWRIDVDSSSAAAIEITQTDRHVHVKDCKAKVSKGQGDAVVLRGVSNVTVDACHLTHGGIVVKDSHKNRLLNTTIIQGGGIEGQNVTDLLVANNTVISSSGDGIGLDASSSSAVVDNTVTGSSGYGIAVSGNNTTVANNLVVENGAGGGGGILAEGQGHVVEGNDLIDNENFAIVVPPGSENMAIRGNNVSGAEGGDRIIVDLGDNPDVEPNGAPVEEPGPDFDARPSTGKDNGDWAILVVAVVTGVLGVGAGLLWWRRRSAL